MQFHSSISLLLLFLFLLLLLPSPIASNTTTGLRHNYLKLHLFHIEPSQPHFFQNHLHQINRRYSLKSPLISGASTGSGQYFAQISIGNPPQNLLLVADTGSDLTWITCSPCRGPHCSSTHPVGSTFFPRQSLTFRPTHCYDSTCDLVPHTPNCPHPQRRTHSSCWYEYSYADGSTTSGIFSRETTSFNSSTGKTLHVPHVSFGCGFNASGPAVSDSGFEGAAGVLGLGRGPISFTTQLGKKFGNKFSYCLVDYTLAPPKTSYLMIGGGHDVVLSGAIKKNNNHQIQSTPLITNQLSPTFFYVSIQAVIINDVKLPISPSVWALDELGDGGTVIDSGTTLTLVPKPAYREILTVMRRDVKLPEVSEPSQPFDLCFNTSQELMNKNDDHMISFPKMRFEFVGGSMLDPPPSNYFIDVAEDVKCLALQGVVSDSGFSVIGNLMQQGFLFEFDNESSRLLFSRHGCGGGTLS